MPQVLALARSRAGTFAALLLLLLSTAWVGAQARLEVELLNSPLTIDDGSTSPFGLRINNPTAEAINATMNWAAPEGAQFVLAPDAVELAPGESRSVFASLHVPFGMTGGSYPLTVRLMESETAITSLQGELRVPERVALDSRLVSEMQTGGDEARLRYEVEVVNRGNRVEDVRTVVVTSPLATIDIDPERFSLAPAESGRLTVEVRPRHQEGGFQTIKVDLYVNGEAEPVSSARFTSPIVVTKASLNDADRDLDFRVAVGARYGSNFSNSVLDTIRARFRGGGYLDEEGTRRFTAAGSLDRHNGFSGRLAYTSPPLDVHLASREYELSALTYQGSGYGLDVLARSPGQDANFSVRAFALLDQELARFQATGAQASIENETGNGGASLQFTYEPERGSAVITGRGVIAFEPGTAGVLAAESGDADGKTELEEVREELDELEGIEDTDEEEPSLEETVAESLVEGAPTGPRGSVAVEGGVDTRQGIAGRADSELFAGPFRLDAAVHGRTHGYGGNPTAGHGFTLQAATSISAGVPMQVTAGYGRNTSIAGGISTYRTALATGVAFYPESSSIGLSAARTTATTPARDSGTESNTFRVDASLNLPQFSIRSTGRITFGSAWDGTAPAGSFRDLEGRLRLSVPYEWGVWQTEASLVRDLIGSATRELEAESLLTVRTGRSDRFGVGVRYRLDDGVDAVTGLVNWRGPVGHATWGRVGLRGTSAGNSGHITTSAGAFTRFGSGMSLDVSGSVRLSTNASPSFSLSALYGIPITIDFGQYDGYGSIAGTVVDASGEPLAGVELRIGRARVRTGPRGEFAMRGVPAGTHLLQVGERSPFIVHPADALVVEVIGGEAASVELTAYEAVSVAGRVRFHVPDPRPDVIFGAGDPARESRLVAGLRLRLHNEELSYDVTTNDAGRFTIPSIVPGNYRLTVVTDLGRFYEIEIPRSELALPEGTKVEGLEIMVRPVARNIDMSEEDQR